MLVLGILNGVLFGLLIGLAVLWGQQQTDLRSVRRRYLGIYEDLMAERRANRDLATRLADKSEYTNLVGVLGDKFADVIHGFPSPIPQDASGEDAAALPRNPAMGDIGLDNSAGVQHQRRQWFPEVEDDPWMEPQDRPPQRDDEVAAWETNPASVPQTPSIGSDPVYTRANGGVRRVDGQQLFRSGQTGPPPEPGVES